MVANPANTQGEYGLLDYWAIARKRWPWILIPLILFTSATAYYSVSQADVYRASAGILLDDTASQETLAGGSQNTNFLTRELANEISLAESDAVENLVQDELGFLPDLSIVPETGADVLVFTATAGDPDTAAVHANTWAEMYVQVKRDEAVANISGTTQSLQGRLQELRVERQQLRSPLDDLDGRISRTANPEGAATLQREYDRLADDLQYELQLVTAQAEATVARLTDLELQAELSEVGEARFVQFAAPPSSRSNPPLSRNIALGVVLGLMVGGGLALLAETRDNTVKSTSDIQSLTDLPVLAAIPAAGKKDQTELALATQRDPEGAYADGYHKLRSAIEFASLGGDIESILVTSPNASEGKSTTSSNLALALSSVGKKTVLLDVDFRRARLHNVYGLNQVPGLSDYVLHDADLTSVAYAVREPGLEDFLVVPSGSVPPSPAAFVGTSGFLQTIDWIESQADVVVLDAPPVLAVSDAQTLSSHVDAVVLTAKAGQTTKAELAEVITVLGQVGANVIGVVLIGVDDSDAYGKRYYYRTDTKASTPATSSAGDLWGDQSSDTGAITDLRESAERLPTG